MSWVLGKKKTKETEILKMCSTIMYLNQIFAKQISYNLKLSLNITETEILIFRETTFPPSILAHFSAVDEPYHLCMH